MPSRPVLFAVRPFTAGGARRCLGERTCVLGAASWLDLAGTAALAADAGAALDDGARDFVVDLTAVVLVERAAAPTLADIAWALLDAGGDIVVAVEDRDVIASLQDVAAWRDFPLAPSVAAALAFLLIVPVGE